MPLLAQSALLNENTQIHAGPDGQQHQPESLHHAPRARRHLRRGRRGFGPGRGPWGWDREYGPHGPGEQGHGRPWGRGGWRRGSAWGLRAEIGPLVGLLRDAFRRGGLDERQVNEIRAVLRDARRRIAAILGETRPSSTEL